MKRLIFLLPFLSSVALFGQISILDATSFHKAGYGIEFGALENTATPDSGGLLTFFVMNQNIAFADDSISEVKVSWNGVYATPYLWWWPRKISYNQFCGVQLKGLQSPLAESDTILIEVISKKGFSATQTFVNETPDVKLVNLIPSQDRRMLYVYLRNDGAAPYSPLYFNLNGLVFVQGDTFSTLTIEALNNWQPLAPGGIGIYKIVLPSALPELTPLMLYVRCRNNLNQQIQTVSTLQRLIKAEFPLGTWNSSLFNAGNEEGRKLLRHLPINSVFGPGNFSLMQNAYDDYKMRVVYEPSFDSSGAFSFATGAANVAAKANKETIHFWNVDDEPDLNGKDLNQEILKNAAYWLNDTNTPSYVNLAVQKKFQRYGFFSDVVSMDHYSDDGPPNAIPFPWWYTTKGSVREAIEYTDQLKWNTEPKRMTTWCQLAADTWGAGHQAEDFIVNFQFWSHVSSGAKGIHYFVATPNTKADYPLQWAEAIQSTQQLNTIKNLCLYGESWKGAVVNSGQVLARALVGEDAITIVILNNSIDYTLNDVFNHDWTASITPVSYIIDVTVPDWIPLEQFYEATANGKSGITSITNIAGRTYRIAGIINEKSQTFVIGKNDTQAPDACTGLTWVDVEAPNNATLSWNEPFDNFGVKGYYIMANNSIIDSTRSPIWSLDGKFSACSYSNWQLAAYDDAGNVSSYASVADPTISGTGSIIIIGQPADSIANAGSNVSFIVNDTGALYVNYQWQVDPGNGIWTDLINDLTYSGVYTNELIVYATQHNNGFKYRCTLSIGCSGNTLTSNIANLIVIGSVDIETVNADRFTISPNPAKSWFVLDYSLTDENTIAYIFDVSGRKLVSVPLPRQKTNVNISALATGVYFITVERNGLVLAPQKLIKY